MVVEATADTSATVEPEIPEKMYSAATTAMPRPPRTQPTSATARSTSRRAMPPLSMSDPARTKSGKARRTNESTWWSICCTVTATGAGEARMAPTKPAAPTATATGAPTTRSPRKSRLTSVMAGRPL